MRRGDCGFTLIELIVTVILLAIVGLIAVQMLGSTVMKAGEPLGYVRDEYEVIEVIDLLSAEYRNQLTQDGTGFSLESFRLGLDSRGHSDVTVTGAYVDFDASGNEYTPGGTTRFLKVTASKGSRSTAVLFTGG